MTWPVHSQAGKQHPCVLFQHGGQWWWRRRRRRPSSKEVPAAVAAAASGAKGQELTRACAPQRACRAAACCVWGLWVPGRRHLAATHGFFFPPFAFDPEPNNPPKQRATSWPAACPVRVSFLTWLGPPAPRRRCGAQRLMPARSLAGWRWRSPCEDDRWRQVTRVGSVAAARRHRGNTSMRRRERW